MRSRTARCHWTALCALLSICSVFLSCSSKSGVVSDPSLSAQLDIAPGRVPTYQELKAVFRTPASVNGLVSDKGQKIENGSAAVWYAGDQDFFTAFFGSSPISDQDRPFKVVVKAPFKGRIAGLRLDENWIDFANSQKDRCGHLGDFGATMSGSPVSRPLCGPIQFLPAKIRAWGIWELEFKGGTPATQMDFHNFLAKIVEREGKLYEEETQETDPHPEMLSLIWQDSAPDQSRTSPVEYFNNPEMNYSLLWSVGRGPTRIMCTEVTKQYSTFYQPLQDGMAKLMTSNTWGSDSSSKVWQAADALRGWSDSYASALRTIGDACRSESWGTPTTQSAGIRKAQEQLARAESYKQTFAVRMQELHVSIEKPGAWLDRFATAGTDR